MIIVYMNDERMGTLIATQMVEKGFESTVLLTGGIEQFLEDCTELVEGDELPVPQKKVLEEKEQKKQQMRKT
jgi:hypothetical protein